MPALPAPLPPPHATFAVDYRDGPLDALLADPRLLAVFGFGDRCPLVHDDPRYLHVALPAAGDAPFECWRVDHPVRCGRTGGIAWSEDGQLQFGALEVPDAGGGDIEAAAAQAYARLQDWLAASDYPHPLRLWNYLDAITAGDGDDERYRRFCVGRAQGIGRALAPVELPAATAIGHPTPTGRLQLYWLAAKTPGTPLENPRQVQAWRYPRQYGPQAPGFARALLPATARDAIAGLRHRRGGRPRLAARRFAGSAVRRGAGQPGQPGRCRAAGATRPADADPARAPG